MRYKLWIWTMARLIPSDYLRVMRIGAAFEDCTSPTAANELLEMSDGGCEITWADWMRLVCRSTLVLKRERHLPVQIPLKRRRQDSLTPVERVQREFGVCYLHLLAPALSCQTVSGWL